MKMVETNVITTGVMAWATSVLKNSADVEQKNLAKAVYIFNQAANGFFKK